MWAGVVKSEGLHYMRVALTLQSDAQRRGRVGAQRSPVGKRSAARGELQARWGALALRSENWGHAQAHERLA